MQDFNDLTMQRLIDPPEASLYLAVSGWMRTVISIGKPVSYLCGIGSSEHDDCFVPNHCHIANGRAKIKGADVGETSLY